MVSSNHGRVLSCRDFNARCKVFSDTSNNILINPFLDSLGDNQLCVANTHGAITHVSNDRRGHSDSILDYTLASPAAAPLISGCKTLDVLLYPDHFGVVFNIAFEHSRDYGAHKCGTSHDSELCQWIPKAKQSIFAAE